MRAIGSSVPSSESRTRSRCCLSPNTICEVRVLGPFSFSLCCTRSERRIVLAAPALSLRKLVPGIVPKPTLISRVRPMVKLAFHWANADYVPAPAWGKVTSVLCVPEVQPSASRVFARLERGSTPMSAFEDHKEEVEHYEQMFGRERGRLAVSLDRLTNALVLVGQHGVYCTSQRNPTLPAMDIRIIANELTSAKELVQAVMEELRRSKNETQI